MSATRVLSRGPKATARRCAMSPITLMTTYTMQTTTTTPTQRATPTIAWWPTERPPRPPPADPRPR